MDNNTASQAQGTNILNTPTPEVSTPPRFNLKGNLVRIVLVILGIVVVLELVWAVSQLIRPGSSATQVVKLPVPSITLQADKSSVKVGDSVRVTVNLDTATRQTVGTDLVLKYDPNLLSVDQSGFQKGTVYSDYPLVSVDPVGTVSASGITAPNQTFIGKGIFGTLILRAKAVGRASVSVDYVPGTTNHSNITESKTAKNVLSEVNNLTINISQ
ncbi:hypothetical protein HY389_01660 [Candidatus Daviesbacteria bacterium]|nr:hypothetical protein [Candidatus Daviesbacteria bacterium]